MKPSQGRGSTPSGDAVDALSGVGATTAVRDRSAIHLSGPDTPAASPPRRRAPHVHLSEGGRSGAIGRVAHLGPVAGGPWRGERGAHDLDVREHDIAAYGQNYRFPTLGWPAAAGDQARDDR
jgi:hypothetical protein